LDACVASVLGVPLTLPGVFSASVNRRFASIDRR
jgi:hypothetical protein